MEVLATLHAHDTFQCMATQDEGRDELREEQEVVPASEFDKQPSTLESFKQAVAGTSEAVMNAASQATKKAKEMTVRGSNKE